MKRMDKEKIMRVFKEYLIPGFAYGIAVNVLWLGLAILINMGSSENPARSLGLLFFIYLGLLAGIGFVSVSRKYGKKKVIAISFMIPFISVGGGSMIILLALFLMGTNPAFLIAAAPFMIVGSMFAAAVIAVPNYLVISMSKKAFSKGGDK
jgi:hypothetical protein